MTKYLILAALIVAIVIGAVASGPVSTYRNLKVLPQGISQERLQRIMVDEFNDGLGVGCGFCHSEAKDSHRLDYASDAKPEKAIARQMMQMTLKVNHRFFHIRRPGIGDSSMVISCGTCHHGLPHPDLQDQ